MEEAAAGGPMWQDEASSRRLVNYPNNSPAPRCVQDHADRVER